jgi:hypothetical protein
MPSNTSSSTGATNTQPDIHPLFRKSQFIGDIDYDTAFRGPSILATRLLDTPQALHFVYAFLYGTNAKAETPLGFIPEGAPAAPRGTELPRQYACNKAIDQLTAEDIQDVREALAGLAHKCHFELRDMESDGETAQWPENKQYSLITIKDSIYRRALLRQAHTEAENALIDFNLAMTMLHEIAHALNITYMGNRLESFFEGSLIAEHGWEFESRLLGLVPHIESDGSPLHEPHWYAWQTQEFCKRDCYDAEFLCRSEWKLPKSCPELAMDPRFAIKLCSDEFWKGEYLQQGAVALIPDVVRALCRAGKGDIITKGIPPSIRELFRRNAGAKSYAEKKYARFIKPSSGMREAFVDPYDEDSEYEEETVEPDVEWSEGESTDASGYNTEEMSDYSDDDATIRGADSDDEMTEVEEWVPRSPKSAVKTSVVKVKGVTKDDFEEEMRKLHEFGEDIRRLLELEQKSRLEMELNHELEERKYAFFSDGP